MIQHHRNYRTGLRVLTVAAVVGTAILVARPGVGRTAPLATWYGAASRGAFPEASPDSVVIQVRDFPSAPIVWVVAWDAAEPWQGLGRVVRRSGPSEPYHRLWVGLDSRVGYSLRELVAVGTPVRDSWAEVFNQRVPVNVQNEAKNCFQAACTPTETIGARTPDGPLRAGTGSVTVTFVSKNGSDVVVTLRRGLIDAYLRTVDSVMASMKK
jgi:hypothetical protein